MRARQTGSQHFNHQGQRTAFVATSGCDCSLQTLRRIGCGVAVLVQCPMGRNWRARRRSVGKVDISRGRRRTVDHQRIIFATWCAKGPGVGAKERRLAPQGAIVDDALVTVIDTRPARASRSAKYPSTPQA